MLIALRFENFRSFPGPVELRMAAHKADKSLQSSLLDGLGRGRSTYKLLPAILIYGANAAGKTNVLKALKYMRSMVLTSHITTNSRGGTNLHDYAFNDDPAKTSFFEVEFIYADIRYKYGFELDSKFVKSEWLFSYPLGRERVLFIRQTEPTDADGKYSTSVDKGDSLSGDERYISGIAKRVREDSLFISVARQDNLQEARVVHDWFGDELDIFDNNDMAFNDAARTSHMAVRYPDFKEMLVALMKRSDPSIIDILITEAAHNGDLVDRFVRAWEGDPIVGVLRDAMKYDVDFVIGNANGLTQTIPFRFQSKGVQQMYRLAAGLLRTLKFGGVFIVDELESSLHPHVAHWLLDQFHDPEVNSNRAQIIATTHDTNLMDQSLLRRDQIWFVEKTGCESHLYSLLDHSPRKDENLETGYLRGKYGALPVLAKKVNWLSEGVDNSRGSNLAWV